MQPILLPKNKKLEITKLSLKQLCRVNEEMYLQDLFDYFNFHVDKLLVVISVLFFNFFLPRPPHYGVVLTH